MDTYARLGDLKPQSCLAMTNPLSTRVRACATLLDGAEDMQDVVLVLREAADELEKRATIGTPNWRMVPVEPAPEQIKAIEFAIYRYSDCSVRDAERGAPHAYSAVITGARVHPAVITGEQLERAAQTYHEGRRNAPHIGWVISKNETQDEIEMRYERVALMAALQSFGLSVEQDHG